MKYLTSEEFKLKMLDNIINKNQILIVAFDVYKTTYLSFNSPLIFIN